MSTFPKDAITRWGILQSGFAVLNSVPALALRRRSALLRLPTWPKGEYCFDWSVWSGLTVIQDQSDGPPLSILYFSMIGNLPLNVLDTKYLCMNITRVREDNLTHSVAHRFLYVCAYEPYLSPVSFFLCVIHYLKLCKKLWEFCKKPRELWQFMILLNIVWVTSDSTLCLGSLIGFPC